MLYKYGAVVRVNPLHNGHEALLNHLGEEAIIAKAASNMPLSARNPLSLEETMYLLNWHAKKYSKRFRFFNMPDFYHLGKEFEDGIYWAEYLDTQFKSFGGVETIVTGDEKTELLMSPKYKIIHPNELIPQNERVNINSSMVKVAIARDDDDGFRNMVPGYVYRFMKANSIYERIRRDFGDEILKKYA